MPTAKGNTIRPEKHISAKRISQSSASMLLLPTLKQILSKIFKVLFLTKRSYDIGNVWTIVYFIRRRFKKLFTLFHFHQGSFRFEITYDIPWIVLRMFPPIQEVWIVKAIGQAHIHYWVLLRVSLYYETMSTYAIWSVITSRLGWLESRTKHTQVYTSGYGQILYLPS